MKPHPVALDDIVALGFPYRMVIPPEYEDENGHMNMRWYLAIYDDAGYPLAARLGLTPEFHAQHGTGGYDLEHHIHYLSEVMVGDTIAVYARLLDRSGQPIFGRIDTEIRSNETTMSQGLSMGGQSVRRGYRQQWSVEIPQQDPTILALPPNVIQLGKKRADGGIERITEPPRSRTFEPKGSQQKQREAPLLAEPAE